MTDKNSMRTRVDRVLPALHALDREWVADLTAIPTDGHPVAAPTIAQCRLAPRTREVTWGKSERSLPAPVTLLEWLIRNLETPVGGWPNTSAKVHRKRMALAARDKGVTLEALDLLNNHPNATKGWWILEGPSRPDAYLETPDAIVVIEGKRTEPGPTTSTEYMPIRHQLLRHIDAAWDKRGQRQVFGMFIVEGDSRGAAPALWRDAARAEWNDDILVRSLPHRSADERQAIGQCVLGVTTWQEVVRVFGLQT